MSDSNSQASASPTPHITELWRYPVKSLLGERLATLRLVADGVEGDRMWGIQDLGDGRILTARREPQLLFASSRVAANGAPVITLPDGQELTGPGRPAGLDRDVNIYKTLHRTHEGEAGMWTQVVQAGSISEGDPVLLA